MEAMKNQLIEFQTPSEEIDLVRCGIFCRMNLRYDIGTFVNAEANTSVDLVDAVIECEKWELRKKV